MAQKKRDLIQEAKDKELAGERASLTQCQIGAQSSNSEALSCLAPQAYKRLLQKLLCPSPAFIPVASSRGSWSQQKQGMQMDAMP